ncbi:MAG TPA: hypothetical protein VEL31_00750, partial [Ktedonobacteraceae bacterium]|nr:hypothetical protein [Ktedonobacteraceae bacterium]
WQTHQYHLRFLSHSRSLKDLRADFLNTFNAALDPIGMLGHHQIAGIIARWWYDSLYDLKTIIAYVNPDVPDPHFVRGFPGLIESKVSSAISVLQDEEVDEDEKEKQPDERDKKFKEVLSNKFIIRLVPDYLRDLEETESLVSDLQIQRKAFESTIDSENGDDDDEDDSENGDEESEDNGNSKYNYAKKLEDRLKEKRMALKDAERKLQEIKRLSKSNGKVQAQMLPLFAEADNAASLKTEVETLRQEVEQLDAQLQPYREIKTKLSEAQKHLNWLKKKETLIKHIQEAHAALTAQQCEDMVLNIAHDDLITQLERYLLIHRQIIIVTIENWWDKYRVTLRTILAERDAAEQKLAILLKELLHEV